jgi:predicted dehydrogenase
MAKRVRFGVMGCGGIGPTHCGAINQIADAELFAVADILPGKAETVGRKYDAERIYGSAEDLLADSEIDVVCICTPSGMHGDGAIAALQAGKHVICEKPMEVSLDRCDAMIRAAQHTGKKLSIISQHRFDAASQIVKEAIDSGKLGRIVLADATVKWWRTQGYYDSGDWRGTWEMDGGGALMNQGVHTVDVLQWLVSGQGKVTSVYGQTRTAAHERIEVEDVAVLNLTFANGAIGSITATTAAWDGEPVRISIYGTEGTAIIEGDRLRLLKFKSGEEYATETAAAHALSVAKGGTASVKDDTLIRAAESDPGAVWGDAHRAQFEDFLKAIHEDTSPLIDGPAGRAPVEIILAAYRSANAGISVNLS